MEANKRTELSEQKKIRRVAKQKARSVSAVSSLGRPVRHSVGILALCVHVCETQTCDYQALVVFQRFSEQPGDDELGVDDEPDLFLHQSFSCNAATHKPVRKVHLTE